MRVCIVVPYDLADDGGVKRHALHLADRLRHGGDEVTVVGPLSRGEAGAGGHGFGGVVNVPFNGADNRMALLTPPGAVRRFFRRNRFDVVHLQEPFVPLLTYYALGLARGAGVVATFHMYWENEPPAWTLVRRTVGRLMQPWIHAAIAVSAPAERFARQAWTRPITVIPNGVPTAVFRPPPPAAAEAARPLRLLFVGSWRDARKGLAVLLEAHRRLRGQGVPVTLDVVGAGPAASPPCLEGVRFHGPVPGEQELARHYRECDVFVSPATGQESFGIVLLEAMASGRPVVCSDIDGYRALAPPGGARLVPPGDVEALAAAVRALAADPAARRRMGEANRRAAEAYDWDILAARVRKEYVTARAVRQWSGSRDRVPHRAIG